MSSETHYIPRVTPWNLPDTCENLGRIKTFPLLFYRSLLYFIVAGAVFMENCGFPLIKPLEVTYRSSPSFLADAFHCNHGADANQECGGPNNEGRGQAEYLTAVGEYLI